MFMFSPVMDRVDRSLTIFTAPESIVIMSLAIAKPLRIESMYSLYAACNRSCSWIPLMIARNTE